MTVDSELPNISDGRFRNYTRSPYERLAGYARAIRAGCSVFVSATSALEGGKIHGCGDARGQTTYVLAQIEKSLQSLGSCSADVIRYRAYVLDIRDTKVVALELGRHFLNIRPAGTLLAIAAFPHPDILVEIEVDAISN